MMNLFIVTYEGDFTQFIIDATDHDNPEQYAIQRAMEVNLKILLCMNLQKLIC